jgi:hypothetical protein
MDGNQARCARVLLVMPGTQRQDKPMRVRFRATVRVVNQHVEIADTVDPAGHAANVLTQSVVEPLLSG